MIGTAEAAKMLGIDRSTLIRQVAAGQVEPAQKLGSATGAYVFNREEIAALAAERSA